MSRRLVITADDLGRDEATDATITSLAADGLITATSLIVLSPHAAAALGPIRDLGLDPGLHATLSSEQGIAPWRPLSDAAGLAADQGQLSSDPRRALATATAQEVLTELDAQLTWMHDHGARPRVLDNHAGTLYGIHGRSFLTQTLRWCAFHALALRLPRHPGTLLAAEPHLAAAHRAAVELADQLAVPLPAAICTNRATAAQHGRYENLREHMITQVRTLPQGTSELFLHPSSAPGERLRARRWEARLLRDPLWHEALAQEVDELVAGWHP